MSDSNLREIKNSLRVKYKSARGAVSADKKAKLDAAIREAVFAWEKYNDADLLLSYVSVDSEADTREIISSALKSGKKVAVPRCVPGTRKMEFYYIDSLSSLSPASYGLLEPEPCEDRKLSENTRGLCFVPGLSFDASGGRLGYGGGYYDRFLANYKGDAAGICYSELLARELLPSAANDVKVPYVITENGIRNSIFDRQCPEGI